MSGGFWCLSFWLETVLVVGVLIGLYWYCTYLTNKSLKGKVILITGCDTGFGNILTKQLDKMGAFVIATCLTKENSEKLAMETSSNVLTYVMDVTSQDQIDSVVKEIRDYLQSQKKHLYGLVNNAGIGEGWLFECHPKNRFNKLLDINLRGVIDVTRSFLPLMRNQQFQKVKFNKFGIFSKGCKGRIVNISSLAGRLSSPGLTAYCIAKTGVIAFSDSIRPSLNSQFGIWVSTIEPQFTLTPMVKNMFDTQYQKKQLNLIPNNVTNIYDKTKMLNAILKDREDVKKMMDTNPQFVINSIITALSSSFPIKHYRPTWLAQFYAIIAMYNPLCIGDILIRLGYINRVKDNYYK